ncbi:MAG TPA: Hsp20/alpha crystallin family protein [Acidobacteriota bacterium]|nr:Hsp20/alpha crystallin family protein [Acidobacteriota bacterium]
MFRELMTLQDRMNRLFEQGLPKAKYEDEGLFGGAWAPAVDIYETDQAIVLKADLPDLNPNDVDIRVEDNMLFLKGERKMEKETKEENYHRVERSYGAFSRSFVLPRTVSSEKIAADYKNGVLKITMPKREESKPKQIRVNVNS